MSVPTKTRREIIKETSDWIGSNRQTKEQINSLNEEWVLLEDHKKEIELAVKKGFDLVEAYEKQIKREGWLSPEQIREKCKILRKDLRKFFNDENENILNEEEMVFRINEVFGVRGAKPK